MFTALFAELKQHLNRNEILISFFSVVFQAFTDAAAFVSGPKHH